MTDWAKATSQKYDDSMLPAWMKGGSSSPSRPQPSNGTKQMAGQSGIGDAFRGLSDLEQGRTNRNPFEGGWSNFGKTMGGVGAAIGGQLNQNADRTADARSQFLSRTTPFTQQAGAVPFGAGGEFGPWLGQQASYRKHIRDEGMADFDLKSKQDALSTHAFTQNEPQKWAVKMQHQLPFVKELFGSLFGGGGSGGAGGSGTYSTNFGASGGFG